MIPGILRLILILVTGAVLVSGATTTPVNIHDLAQVFMGALIWDAVVRLIGEGA